MSSKLTMLGMEHEDWRDGMNKFRSNLVAILQEMDQRLKKLEEKINV